jgi:DNA replication and repair protein RecF
MKLIIKTVNLVNFRNYENSTIHFSDKLNIIYGENAQGKTNILEAIFLCSAGRSHRTSKDGELVKYNEKFYRVRVNVQREKDIKKEIEILYDGSKKKVTVK